MVKELLFAPVVAMIMLSLGMTLVDVAESTSNKAIAFADDMNGAMDCATRGIPIEVCSPSLTAHDFNPEIAQFKSALNHSNLTSIEDIDYRMIEQDSQYIVVMQK